MYGLRDPFYVSRTPGNSSFDPLLHTLEIFILQDALYGDSFDFSAFPMHANVVIIAFGQYHSFLVVVMKCN